MQILHKSCLCVWKELMIVYGDKNLDSKRQIIKQVYVDLV